MDSHANTQPRGAIPAHVGEERIVEDGVWRLDVVARCPRNVTVHLCVRLGLHADSLSLEQTGNARDDDAFYDCHADTPKP